MKVLDPRIVTLRETVRAAQEEFDLATAFHELWKPAAYNDALRIRMGVSYATNAFHVVRIALRREMILALMRLWDKSAKAVRLDAIARELRDPQLISALAEDRAARFPVDGVLESMRQDLQSKADEVLQLIDSYSPGGARAAVLKGIRKLRHERLAHRQVQTAAATSPDHSDDDIESFYQDASRVIEVLLSLVNAIAYSPEDTAGVYRRYSGLFWEPVCGEETEGHPRYRKR
jgi:hypothetical protein